MAQAGLEDDWTFLTINLDDALTNPALPRWYRAKYEALRAWTSDIPEENIERAKHWIGQVRRVMQDRSEEDKREMIEPLEAMVAAVEEAMGLAENAQAAAIPKTEAAEEAKEAEPTGDEAGPSQLMMDARAEPAPGVKRKRMLRKITPNMNFMLLTPPTTGPKAKRTKSNISEGAQQNEAVVGEEGGDEGGGKMEGTGRTELGYVEEESEEEGEEA
ncbi:hypothetical protein LTR27_001385 [Elasticomyces elasticus]|nr:hypothetical protein LTR27_001385 [Elasticomyces elasticus]